MNLKIILASASERRSRILSEYGIPHRIVVSGVREIIDTKKGAGDNALFNASLKTNAVAKRFKSGYVIGADTVVLSGKHLIGKPQTKQEARSLLKEFSGKTISVWTGLCVTDIKRQKTVKAVVTSKVKVRKLTPAILNRFLKVAGPFDKAGGFSIEGVGSFIFDNIEGSFYNVLGLPTGKLYELFGRLGVDLLRG